MKFLFVLAVVCLLTSGFAIAGTFSDNFNDNLLDPEYWTPFLEESGGAFGKVEEVNGRIEISELPGDWAGGGLRFEIPIDLTAGKFTMEGDVLPGTTGFYFSYFCSAYQTAGIWDPGLFGFWFDAGDKVFGWEDNGGASPDPKPAIPAVQGEWHHVKVELTPTADVRVYNYHLDIDYGAGEASGVVTLSEDPAKLIDPASVYLYFNAEFKNLPNEPSYLDNIIISSPSILGVVTTVEPSGKLSAAWGGIKSDY